MTTTTTIKVHIFSHYQGHSVRMVKLPKDFDPAHFCTADILDEVWCYGQNTVQPVDGCYSVSDGDVIELSDRFFLVQSVGYREMTTKQFEQHKASQAKQAEVDEIN